MSKNVYSTAHEEGFIAPFAADEESPYIFISYAHEDRDRVFPIIRRLYEQGWRIWYDEGIPPASNYHNVIASHIADCALFLMFVTQNACERPYVIDNEVDYAIRRKSREQIMLCFLEKDIVIPAGAEMLLGDVDKPKYRSVEESELEGVLPEVKGLTCGGQREAIPVNLKGGNRVVADDGGMYDFVKCKGGVRLTKYLGSDTDVVVPAEYPAGTGQKVVELKGTFSFNKTVRTVRLPATVKSIKSVTFSGCTSLTDVYIPSSVIYLDSLVFGSKGCKIHCAEGSAALDYAIEEKMDYLLDDSLAVTDDSADDTAQTAYAYISYSADIKERAAEIIGAIEKHNCVVFDGGRTSGVGETVGAINECTCFVALVSNDYIAGADIQFFRMVSKMNKPKLLYVLEACELPPDLSIENDSQQQLRYDSLNEEQRTAKLIDWLQENGCRRVSADIPDFEYTATKENGITLTKYTGSGGEVVIEREYGGVSVTSIGDEAFHGCSSLTGITIPDSITGIGNGAFRGCRSLTGITIPDSVTSISDLAFCGCSSLTGITIPDSVTSIGYGAFSGCSSLTAITIPDRVTRIGDSAFYGCSSLTAITIPDRVTSIGYGAFYGCSNLTVNCPENSYAWQYCEKNKIKHTPFSSAPEHSAEPEESTAAEQAETTMSAVDTPATPAEPSAETAPSSTPRKKSPARWLIPLLILIALAAAAGLQLSGLVDILGLLGL